MKPANALIPARVASDECLPGPDSALDALRDPLAVILGRTQMLERRILHGETISTEDHLATLTHILRSVWDLEHRLRAIQADAWRAPDEG